MKGDNITVFNKLKNIILNIKPGITEKISLDSNIVDDLGFSSFEIFVLVHDAEKEFNSKIVEQNIKDNLVIKNFINLILNNQFE